jgi:hypothetical protein
MVIDFHTHIFPPEVIKRREDYMDDPCFAMLYSSPKAKLASADDLISAMDEAGVEMAVVCGISWIRDDYCIECNRYILESVARYPERLIGFVSLPLSNPQIAMRELEVCRGNGARGVGELRVDEQHFDQQEDLAPVFEAMRDAGLILLLHSSEPVGHSYAGKGLATPDVLYSFIARYPGLKIVCAHWGGGLPFYNLMPEVRKVLASTYFDTAASPFLYHPDIYRAAVLLVGAERLLFGTDYPLLGYRRTLSEVTSLDLPVEVKEAILAGNAKKLLGQ